MFEIFLCKKMHFNAVCEQFLMKIIAGRWFCLNPRSIYIKGRGFNAAGKMERAENCEVWHRGSRGEKRKVVSRNYIAFI